MVDDLGGQGNKSHVSRTNSGAVDEDHDVIRRVLAGTTEAYRYLVKKYQGPVYNLLIRMGNDKDDAKELTQDVFVRAYEYLPRFRFRHKFFSWVYRIAIHASLAHLQKKQRYMHLPDKDIADEGSWHDHKDNRDHIRLAVSRLHDDHKVVVLLKYFEEMSYKDIACALDLPERTIRSRLYEARQKLKTVLETSGYF